MNARDQVELASLAAAYGRILMRGDEPLPEESVQRYWMDSKVRFERWTNQLRRFTEEPRYVGVDATNDNGPPSWRQVRVWVEEIFLSEVLTRVWAAVGIGVDRSRDGYEVEPVVKSVVTGHTDCCNRAMRLLLDLPRNRAAEAAALNNVHLIAARWTNVLIGVVSIDHDLTSLAADPAVAAEMANEIRSRVARGREDADHAALIGPLLTSTRALALGPSGNEDINARIAASVVACFRPALFDGAGVMRFEWLYRLHQVTLDSQLMIDEWLDGDSHSRVAGIGAHDGHGASPGSALPASRWRFRSGKGD